MDTLHPLVCCSRTRRACRRNDRSGRAVRRIRVARGRLTGHATVTPQSPLNPRRWAAAMALSKRTPTVVQPTLPLHVNQSSVGVLVRRDHVRSLSSTPTPPARTTICRRGLSRPTSGTPFSRTALVPHEGKVTRGCRTRGICIPARPTRPWMTPVTGGVTVGTVSPGSMPHTDCDNDTLQVGQEMLKRLRRSLRKGAKLVSSSWVLGVSDGPLVKLAAQDP